VCILVLPYATRDPVLAVTVPLHSQGSCFLLMQKTCICLLELDCMHSCSALGDIGMACALTTSSLLFFSERTCSEIQEVRSFVLYFLDTPS
jgi:hypothetical protein